MGPLVLLRTPEVQQAQVGTVLSTPGCAVTSLIPLTGSHGSWIASRPCSE